MMSQPHEIPWYRRGYYRRLEIAAAAALGIHAVVIWFAPPYVPRPYRLEAPPLTLVAAAIQTAGAPPAVAPAWASTQAASGEAVGVPVVSEQLRSPVETPAPSSATGRVGGGEAPVYYQFDQAPTVTHRAEPEYSVMARELGAEGTVIVNANVDESGKVLRAWVALSTAPEVLIQAALDAAYSFRFEAGSAQGIPVKCTVAIPFHFKLNREEPRGGG